MKKILISILIAVLIFIFCIRFRSFDFINQKINRKINTKLKLTKNINSRFYFDIFSFSFVSIDEIDLENDLIDLSVKEIQINPIIKNIKFKDFELKTKINIKSEDVNDKNKFFILDEIKKIIRITDYNLMFRNGTFQDLNIDKLNILTEKEPKIIIESYIRNENIKVEFVFERILDNLTLNVFSVNSELGNIIYKKSNSVNNYLLNLSTDNLKSFLHFIGLDIKTFDVPIDVDLNINNLEKEIYLNGLIRINKEENNIIKIKTNITPDYKNYSINIHSEKGIDLRNKSKKNELISDQNKNTESFIFILRNILQYLYQRYNISIEGDIKEVQTDQFIVDKFIFNTFILDNKIEIKDLELNVKDNFNLLVQDNLFVLDVNSQNKDIFDLMFLRNDIKELQLTGNINKDIENLKIQAGEITINEDKILVNEISRKKIDLELHKLDIDQIFEIKNNIFDNKSVLETLKNINSFKKLELNINILDSTILDFGINKLNLNLMNTDQDSKILINGKTDIFEGGLNITNNIQYDKINDKGNLNVISNIDYLDFDLMIFNLKNIIKDETKIPLFTSIDGILDLKINKLKIKDKNLRNITVSGKINNGIINFSGQDDKNIISFNSTLNLFSDSSKIDIGFSFNAFQLSDIFNNICTNLKNYTDGYISFNGRFYSYGASFGEIYSNAVSKGNVVLQNTKIKDFDIISTGYEVLYRKNINLERSLKTNKGVIENTKGYYRLENGKIYGDLSFSQEISTGNASFEIDLRNNFLNNINGNIIIATKDRFSKNQLNMKLPFLIKGSCSLSNSFDLNIELKELKDYISKINAK